MTENQPTQARPPGLVRRVYDWVLHWADTRWALPALFLISFAESSFFPIPPDVLLVALCVGNRAKSHLFALWCSVASVLGGIAGYGIGAFFWGAVDDICYRFLFTPEMFEGMRQTYAEWDFWIVFVAAFTPIPYKLITISAGVFDLDFTMFVVASVIGRSARFFLVAELIRRFGPPIREFIEKRFELVTIAGTLLLVGGFVAVRYLF
ncbi:MAG: hypothetical protein RL148_3126 [Planctomycetota bacterium]